MARKERIMRTIDIHPRFNKAIVNLKDSSMPQLDLLLSVLAKVAFEACEADKSLDYKSYVCTHLAAYIAGETRSMVEAFFDDELAMVSVLSHAARGVVNEEHVTLSRD
jgi:hypothetical protein